MTSREWPLNRGHSFRDARSQLPEACSTRHKTLDQKASCGERPGDDGDDNSCRHDCEAQEAQNERRASDHGHCNPARRQWIAGTAQRTVTLSSRSTSSVKIQTQVERVGGADDHDSSSRLWGDAGVNAELGLAGISSLARGGRASKQFRV